MANIILLIGSVLVGLNMILVNANVQPDNKPFIKKIANQERMFEHLMGKSNEQDKHEIQRRQHEIFNDNHENSFKSPIESIEDLACLEACYQCIEDSSDAKKRRTTDYCGPSCDCANNCSKMTVKQINKIYGKFYASRGDKGCFMRTYSKVIKYGPI